MPRIFLCISSILCGQTSDILTEAWRSVQQDADNSWQDTSHCEEFSSVGEQNEMSESGVSFMNIDSFQFSERDTSEYMEWILHSVPPREVEQECNAFAAIRPQYQTNELIENNSLVQDVADKGSSPLTPAGQLLPLPLYERHDDLLGPISYIGQEPNYQPGNTQQWNSQTQGFATPFPHGEFNSSVQGPVILHDPPLVAYGNTIPGVAQYPPALEQTQAIVGKSGSGIKRIYAGEGSSSGSSPIKKAKRSKELCNEVPFRRNERFKSNLRKFGHCIPPAKHVQPTNSLQSGGILGDSSLTLAAGNPEAAVTNLLDLSAWIDVFPELYGLMINFTYNKLLEKVSEHISSGTEPLCEPVRRIFSFLNGHVASISGDRLTPGAKHLCRECILACIAWLYGEGSLNTIFYEKFVNLSIKMDATVGVSKECKEAVECLIGILVFHPANSCLRYKMGFIIDKFVFKEISVEGIIEAFRREDNVWRDLAHTILVIKQLKERLESCRGDPAVEYFHLQLRNHSNRKLRIDPLNFNRLDDVVTRMKLQIEIGVLSGCNKWVLLQTRFNIENVICFLEKLYESHVYIRNYIMYPAPIMHILGFRGIHQTSQNNLYN